MFRKKIGLYIHIPFCVSKCRYCDFLSMPYDYDVREQYTMSLCKEIERFAKEHADEYVVNSVFFGGGTPSMLEPELFEKIISTVRDNFKMNTDSEITIECNPGTVTYDKLGTYKENGVNRISFGLQSANDSELKALGRIHTFSDFMDSYDNALKAGFNNINVDIMSALPSQGIEGYRNTLEKVLSLDIKHISAYSLIIEEGTPFFEMNEKGLLKLPSEEDERQMYYMTEELLAKNGFHRYEISNYARDGYECRHNKIYWERGEYAGFGLGAASLISDIRYSNTGDMKEYLEDFSSGRENEILSLEDKMSEFMFLGLRMTKGIEISEFERQFKSDIYDIFGSEIKKHEGNGLLVEKEGRLMLTGKGFDLSNYVFADFYLG